MVCIGQISISFFRAGSGGGHCKLPSAVNIPCETKVREGCLYQVVVVIVVVVVVIVVVVVVVDVDSVDHGEDSVGHREHKGQKTKGGKLSVAA